MMYDTYIFYKNIIIFSHKAISPKEIGSNFPRRKGLSSPKEKGIMFL
jgi:hypothetical protein